MIAKAECIPCLVNQGLNALKKLNLNEELQKEVALRAVQYLSRFKTIDKSPAYYAYYVQQIVKELTGKEDPFKEQKRIANAKALEMLPSLMKDLETSEDPLAYALKVSACGNLIDFAVMGNVDFNEVLKDLLKRDFAVWDYDKLLERLQEARNIFIIGDNAGEIAFDKLLVKVLKDSGKEVFYGVKGKPILNDATLEDAKEVSMTDLCTVIDNGSDKVGTWLEDCSEEFRKIFFEADVVISKGQANYETLSNVERDLFFLLTAKCNPIARELDGEKGKLVLRYKSVLR